MELTRLGKELQATLTDPLEVDAVAGSLISRRNKTARIPFMDRGRNALATRALEHGMFNRDEPMILTVSETSLAMDALRAAKGRIESMRPTDTSPPAPGIRPVISSMVDALESVARPR